MFCEAQEILRRGAALTILYECANGGGFLSFGQITSVKRFQKGS
jgi:hypothetical protein